MIVITVVPKHKLPLICMIESSNGPLTTNVPKRSIPFYKDRGCSICDGVKNNESCNLLSSLAPVLYYFSDIVSYEEVMVEFKKERYHSKYPETAQKACFAVCVYAMFYSSCNLFGQFKFLLDYYRANITPDAYMHMVLTTTLIKRQVDLNEIYDRVDVFHEVEKLNDKFKSRLLHVFDEAKFFQQKDAAVNAVNIAFSLNTLSAENLEFFYEDFLENIKSLK